MKKWKGLLSIILVVAMIAANFTGFSSMVKAEGETMLQTNNGETLGTMAIGGKVWSDQTYKFSYIPDALLGKEYVLGGINNGVNVTALKDGYLYAITVGDGWMCGQANLEAAGFTKIDMTENWCFANFGNPRNCWVYEKAVTAGDNITLAKWWGTLIASESQLDVAGKGIFLQPLDSAKMGVTKIGGQVWSSSTAYQFKSLPTALVGQEYIYTGLNTAINAKALVDGYVYVLTMAEGSANGSIARHLYDNGWDRIEIPQWSYVGFNNNLHSWVYEKQVKKDDIITLPGSWTTVIASPKKLDLTDNGVTVTKENLAVLESTTGATTVDIALGQTVFTDNATYTFQEIPYWLGGKSIILGPRSGGTAKVTKAGTVYMIGGNVAASRVSYFTDTLGFTQVDVAAFAPWGKNSSGGNDFSGSGFGLYKKEVAVGDTITWNWWAVPVFYSDSKLPIQISGIEVTKMPNKTEYKIGEAFDPTGMEVSGVDRYGNKQVLTKDLITAPNTFTADVYGAGVIYHEYSAPIPVTITDAPEKEYDMSKFTTQQGPVIAPCIEQATTQGVIDAIRQGELDGATTFLVFISNMNWEERTYENFKKIADSTEYPVMAVNYGDYGSTTDRINQMKEAVRAGFDIVDIPMNTFDPDCKASLANSTASFASAQPNEVSMGADVIAQQKALVQEFKDMGAEVLISAHIGVRLDEIQGVDLAFEIKSRGADVVKIVAGWDDNWQNSLQILNTNMRLKAELGVPFYYNASGDASRPYRAISTLFGSHMIFSYVGDYRGTLSVYENVDDLVTYYNQVPELKQEFYQGAPDLSSESLIKADLSDKLMGATSYTMKYYHAEAAFDGDDNTLFLPKDGTWPQTLMKDLGEIKNISQINLNLEQVSVWEYKIYISEDGKTWTVYDRNPSDIPTQQKYTHIRDAKARYVALNITRSGYDATGVYPVWAAVREMEIIEQGTGVNLSLQGLSGATSVFDVWDTQGTAVVEAFDGDMKSKWVTAEDTTSPQQLIVDLGNIYQVGAVYVGFLGLDTWDYKVEISEDSATWSDFATCDSVKQKEVTLKADKQARYIRLTITGSKNNVRAGVREVAVYTKTAVSASAFGNINAVPTMPETFKTSLNENTIVLNWNTPTDVGDGTLSGYQVRKDNGEWIDVSENTYNFTNLTYWQEYKFEVRAKSSFGEGLLSERNALLILYGDINRSSVIDDTDMKLFRKYFVETHTLEGVEAEAADVNKDGTLSITDLVAMKKRTQ